MLRVLVYSFSNQTNNIFLRHKKFLISTSSLQSLLTPWIEKVSMITHIERDLVCPTRTKLLHLTLTPQESSEKVLESTGFSFQKDNNINSFSSLTDEQQQQKRLPAAYHLTCFPPLLTEKELASDGYDTLFTPPEPFKQRMWAGGEFVFHSDNPLKLGQNVKQVTQVDRIESRETGSRGSIVFVWLKKIIENEFGPSIEEKRCYAYMKTVPTVTTTTGDHEHTEYGSSKVQKDTKMIPVKSSTIDRFDFKDTINPTPVLLFRYSALTFNSHLIHYNQDYSRHVEGYPDCLVHGPLTCTLLLQSIEKFIKPKGMNIQSFSYKAVSPLNMGQKFIVGGKISIENGKKIATVMAINDQGGLSMKGTAELI